MQKNHYFIFLPLKTAENSAVFFYFEKKRTVKSHTRDRVIFSVTSDGGKQKPPKTFTGRSPEDRRIRIISEKQKNSGREGLRTSDPEFLF